MLKPFIQKHTVNKPSISYSLSITFLVITFFLGVGVGTVQVSFKEMMAIFSHHLLPLSNDVDPLLDNIVLNIRLPRVILAGLVGASLSLAGAAFQGLLRNPLADPYTLGVSSGASVGAVTVIFFQISLPFMGLLTLPIASIIAAFITIFIVLFFARKIEPGMRVETIILTGIIFSSFLGAFLSLIIALSGQELRQIIGWLLGSVSMRGWGYVWLNVPFFLIGAFLLLFNTRELNAMSFGEEQAQHLGVNVEKRKRLVLFAGSLLTGAAVAVSGTIGFVGLVIPHLTRLLWGPDHKHLLPLSMFVGAGFLILADLIARTIIQPAELPIGVITAIIGAPVFAIILMRRRKESRG
ncbi:FecCD family ABC transporter permease [Lederbergia galactosidilytica]|uniref:Corrinoid ABC transporter permease n=1 Tax=Lederbergia galactosidilytica TaxID=217031 RepID=A0A177ZJK7_9BACI|nr:iron ABC transporter permease [Lederbergia galactosidilytica]MBP1915556.1 iron complex transport system permease protein [Lederbergia galactosidilytica]OAK67530.1 corrinoid ABC transporter permease [Lederbergia galactosidilytica]